LKDSQRKMLESQTEKRGRKKWPRKVAEKSGREKWPKKVAEKSGREKWPKIGCFTILNVVRSPALPWFND
jgi:hypothetical protein